MQLDGIDELMANESTPLVCGLQSIIENLKLYLPYLPETVLALARGESADTSIQSSPLPTPGPMNDENDSSNENEEANRTDNALQMQQPQEGGSNESSRKVYTIKHDSTLA